MSPRIVSPRRAMRLRLIATATCQRPCTNRSTSRNEFRAVRFLPRHRRRRRPGHRYSRQHSCTDFYQPRAVPECVQRLSVHRARRAHLPDHAYQRSEDLHPRRSSGHAGVFESGHHEPAPRADGTGRPRHLRQRQDQTWRGARRRAAMPDVDQGAVQQEPQQGYPEHHRIGRQRLSAGESSSNRSKTH